MEECWMAKLTDEELQKLSLEKQRNGCATPQALQAQRLLAERHDFSASLSGRFRKVLDRDGVASRSTKRYFKENDWRGEYE